MDPFYTATNRRSRGALWSIFAPALIQNDFGITLGGPLVRIGGDHRLFFFASYEGLRLVQPQTYQVQENVPSAALRAYAAPSVQPYLNAFPLPNGAYDATCTVPGTTGTLAQTSCDGQYLKGFSVPSRLDSGELRLDTDLSKKIHAFARYSETPTYTLTGPYAENLSQSVINTRAYTAGVTDKLSTHLVNDFRFNYTLDHEENNSTQASINGSTPFDSSLLIPAQYAGPGATLDYQIRATGTSLSVTHVAGSSASAQHQLQLVDTVTWSRGAHSLSLGGDWRHMTPTVNNEVYFPYLIISAAKATALNNIHNGIASSFSLSAGSAGKPIFDNLSLFVTDHWKLSPRFSLDYGVRWEFNPPPRSGTGLYPIAISSSDLNTAKLLPSGTQPFKTYYNHFAPRVGFAYRPYENATLPTVLRASFGIFFDTAQQTIGNAYNHNSPFVAYAPTQSNVYLPLSSALQTPPSTSNAVDITDPNSFFVVMTPGLTAPYTESWNLSVDQALSRTNTLTISYVGNEGKKLLFTDTYYGSGVNFYGGANITSNAASSYYHALQVQDSGHITRDLDLVSSFTWAHAIDNSSSDFTYLYPVKGNSDYDLRKQLNVALNYKSNGYGEQRVVRGLTGGWTLSNIFTARSGTPVNIIQATDYLPNGEQRIYSPDLVAGQPIYLHGAATSGCANSKAPGGWCVNPNAFTAAKNDANGYPIVAGSVGRNFVRNPGFWAWNTSLQRTFPILESMKLDFRVDAFNVLNHASLSGINQTYAKNSTTFGLLNGDVTSIGAANTLFATGGPRSLQLSLKLKF